MPTVQHSACEAQTAIAEKRLAIRSTAVQGFLPLTKGQQRREDKLPLDHDIIHKKRNEGQAMVTNSRNFTPMSPRRPHPPISRYMHSIIDVFRGASIHLEHRVTAATTQTTTPTTANTLTTYVLHSTHTHTAPFFSIPEVPQVGRRPDGSTQVQEVGEAERLFVVGPQQS